uniref:LRRCT domain-containing protein n=1 Tax=Xiphophorus couchianus TaxID=32473 RepID=A0A3B5L004_9TELE
MCILAACVFLGVLLLLAPSQCLACPFGCECFAVTHTVKCVSKDLLVVPQDIPGYTRNVNDIKMSKSGCHSVSRLLRITELASHTFASLTSLHSLDLSGNQLALIHPEALSIPGSPLQELNLSCSLHNFTTLTDLATALRWGGLWGLRRLDLSGNLLALLPPGMFSHTLDLTHNDFEAFRVDALQELERLGNAQIFLGNNPYTCSCESRDFVTWLNKTRARVDGDAVRCASPEELVADLTLQTSYVFLGLVLGLVGMVFLFVLYLNRNGMKKWIIETRDACRDVLEGYHYRYEIDSDPRLGHITAGGSRSQRHLGQALSQQLPNDTCIVQTPTETQVKPVSTSPAVNS